MLQWIHTNRKVSKKAVTILGVLLVAVFLFLINYNTAIAQSIADPSSSLREGVSIIQQPLGLPAFDIRVIIANIIKTALQLIGIVLVCLMLYAGYLWMTAGGNDDQIAKAKAIIKNAVIGLVIILAAYSIVLFVMNMLGVGTGGGGGEDLNAPRTTNFQGSGALGGVIKDHYPSRDQTGVSRNTKIFITFRRPVLLSSFVEDSNGNGILGDCTAVQPFDWYLNCDHIKKTGGILDNNIINIIAVSGTPVIDAAITAQTSTPPGGVAGVYTIAIKPFTSTSTHPDIGLLGSDTADIQYRVRLGRNILINDPENNYPSAFNSSAVGNDYYEWKFTCGREADLTPPFVEKVFPDRSGREARNSVIQITFSEAIDPTGVQGQFSALTGSDAGAFGLPNGYVFLKNNPAVLPPGTFNIVNGYRTLEFTPTIECGTNACGGKMYCLPVCADSGSCTRFSTNDFEIVLQAARTYSATSFESQPFTGIADASGNALNGDKEKPPMVDIATTTRPIFNNWKVPDNDYWTFRITNEIDNVSPYLISVFPGLEAGNVAAKSPLEMVFSKTMRVEPLYNIGILEKPVQPIPLCKVPYAYFPSDSDHTQVKIGHCPFIDGTREDYLPVVTSTVEDVHFNCFYPGKGPKNAADPSTKASDDCESTGTCCAVTTSSPSAFCCNGNVANANATSVNTCYNNVSAPQ